MMTMAAAMIAVSATAALAGTKYQSSLVNASTTDPPSNPTMSVGKVQVKDTGDIKAQVKGVTDGTGALVTSSTAVKDTGDPDDTSYIAIIKANYVPLNIDVEIAVPMDVKKGGGKGGVSLASLTSLITPGVGRSIAMNGAEVWGPLGAANVAACNTELNTGFAIGSSACKGGTRIGVGGVDIP
jgi:hypothetical protein